MRRMLFCSALLLIACDGSEPVSQAPADVTPADCPELLGNNTYAAACARCHDSGLDGAPVIGQPDTWSGRSAMWRAVLTEHAKNGYLEMPARGGEDALSDEAVAAATEYMLCETWPELPRD